MKIVSTGRYTPKNVLTNAQLEKLVDTTDEWITSRTGINERRITTGENTSDMAYNAGIAALGKAEISADKLDLIIVCTCTPDAFFPSVASFVQRKMGITCMAFDLNAACSGFVYGITVAKGLMSTGQYKYALLIGAEVLSKIVNYQDRGTSILFGDGAGAVVLEHSQQSSVLYTYCDAKPDNSYALKSGGVPLVNPFFEEEAQDYRLQMLGQEVFKFAVTAVGSSIDKTLKETGTTLDEIDYFLCHQANYRILKKIAKNLNVDESRFYMNVGNYGNTSSASIPIALDEMNEKGLIKSGTKLLIVGFGAGLTWGSALVQI